MSTTTTTRDNFQVAKALGEPIGAKKSANAEAAELCEREEWLERYHESEEFLASLKEAQELEEAYKRGEIKAQSFEEFRAEMEQL